MRTSALKRTLWSILLVVVLTAGCTVVPPEGVGPHVPPDWSNLNPAATPAPTSAPAAKLIPAVTFPYEKFPNMPLHLKDFVRPESCNWMGIAGQVFDKNGNPVSGIVVKIGGELGGVPVNNWSTTGNVAEYGPGGYEIDIAAAPAASASTLWVMLMDSQVNQLSARNFFDTYADCENNLILFNFSETIPNKYYFPIVFR
jgi:hypothetical protein